MHKITEKDAERIAARFKEVAPDAECPLCKNNDFNVPATVAIIPTEANYPNLFGGGRIDAHFACAPLICITCGNTFFLNIRGLGELDDIVAAKW